MFFIDICLGQSLVHHGDDVLLMGPRSQFWDNPSILPVDFLCGHHIAQYFCIAQHGGGSIITG